MSDKQQAFGDQAEEERIRSVYSARDNAGRRAMYAWHRPEILAQEAARARVAGTMLASAIGTDLRTVRALDVGCGTGAFLRQLIEWGAEPANLVGTEFLEDRLEEATLRSASGVHWRLGGIVSDDMENFDLVVANTVFSSILDDAHRSTLAAEMWGALKPGGWCMIFDFRYNNPSNPNVRKVTRSELLRYWPAIAERYKTLLLAPPIARRITGMPDLLSEILTTIIPVLRSHFVYMGKKAERPLASDISEV